MLSLRGISSLVERPLRMREAARSILAFSTLFFSKWIAMCKFLVGFWFFWPNHTYALNHYAIGTVAGGALGTSVYILSYVAPRLDFGRMIVRKKNLGFRTISFLNNVRRWRVTHIHINKQRERKTGTARKHRS